MQSWTKLQSIQRAVKGVKVSRSKTSGIERSSKVPTFFWQDLDAQQNIVLTVLQTCMQAFASSTQALLTSQHSHHWWKLAHRSFFCSLPFECCQAFCFCSSSRASVKRAASEEAADISGTESLEAPRTLVYLISRMINWKTNWKWFYEYVNIARMGGRNRKKREFSRRWFLLSFPKFEIRENGSNWSKINGM